MKELKKRLFFRKPSYIASVSIIFTALIILLHYINLAYFPTKTVEVYSATVLDTEVDRGKNVLYELDWCSFGNYEVTVNMRLVDGYVTTLPPYTTTTPQAGCFKSKINSATVPEQLLPGEYYLQVDLVVRVNSIRNEIIHYETDTFRVK